jgi:hypothetical protein
LNPTPKYKLHNFESHEWLPCVIDFHQFQSQQNGAEWITRFSPPCAHASHSYITLSDRMRCNSIFSVLSCANNLALALVSLSSSCALEEKSIQPQSPANILMASVWLWACGSNFFSLLAPSKAGTLSVSQSRVDANQDEKRGIMMCFWAFLSAERPGTYIHQH